MTWIYSKAYVVPDYYIENNFHFFCFTCYFVIQIIKLAVHFKPIKVSYLCIAKVSFQVQKLCLICFQKQQWLWKPPLQHLPEIKQSYSEMIFVNFLYINVAIQMKLITIYVLFFLTLLHCFSTSNTQKDAAHIVIIDLIY